MKTDRDRAWFGDWEKVSSSAATCGDLLLLGRGEVWEEKLDSTNKK